ncbi:MAG: 1-acyl-sn-glycerol-3-phosphate acyltransferase [Aquihabitans sp.]
MKRPDVKLENYEAVYRYYEAHDQSRAFARLAHKLFARHFKVDLSVADGAEQAITDAIAAGTRLVISPNHITGDDQYVIVALVEHMKALHPLRASTFIPSEPSLFTRRGLAGKALRRSVDGLGAVPTFRLEDLRRQGIEITDEIDELYRHATIRASEAQVAKLVRGEKMAGFWEGTRNRSDYRVVQPLKKGIAHTVIAAAEQIDVAVLPVGFYYGSEPDDYKRPDVPGKRNPHVHVGMPIPVETTSATELVDLVHPAMQECLDVVVARAVAAAGALTPV